MKPHQKKILKFLMLLFIGTGLFLFVTAAFAQNFGINEVGNTIALQAGDPRVIAAQFIRIALGFLGIVALAIVLYGGFIWMTAAGNEERITKAKKILTGGLIGLVIIAMAFGITQYVLNALIEATGGGGGGGEGGGGPVGGELPSDALRASSFYPLNGETDVIRNVIITVSFNLPIDPASVSESSFIVRKTDGTPVAGTRTVLSANPKIIEFESSTACPDPDGSINCLDKNTEFQIQVTDSIQRTGAGDRSLKCGGLAPSCTSSFTTGEAIDRNPPTVNIEYPDSTTKICAENIFSVQTSASDDGGIRYIDYFDGEPDPYGTDTGPIETLPRTAPRQYTSGVDWDTTGKTVGSDYILTAKAFDADRHDTTSGGVSVRMRASHCCNGFKDAADGEIDIDCGGPCGGCPGDSCTSDADCAGGVCRAGQCLLQTTIMGVFPVNGRDVPNGAVGNYVTITGFAFGREPGRVFFGATEAQLPAACSAAAAWQDRQIIVGVPSGLSIGDRTPIRVEAKVPTGALASDYTDQTDDERGPHIENFEVNDTRRPGVCSVCVSGVTPCKSEGTPRTEVTVSGTQFGSRATGDDLFFGGTAAGSISGWNDGEIGGAVPLIAPATVPVQVTVGGENSNPVNFTVLPSAERPQILSFEPQTGPVGEYVTIFGSNFGNQANKVYFKNATTGNADVEADIPDACGTDWWKNDQIIVKVPADAGTGIIRVKTYDGPEADTSSLSPSSFTLNTTTPKPGLCSVVPNNGPVTTPITLNGERFGGTRGTSTANFWQNKPADITNWTDAVISGKVPAGAETGPVNVTVGTPPDAKTSNRVNFTVRDCRTSTPQCPKAGQPTVEDPNQDCCASGSCAPAGTCVTPAGRGYYYWRFSTGTIPIYPQVIEECTGAPPPPQPSPSPAPWDGRGETSVCVNAKISVRFSTGLDLTTLTIDNVQVYKCTGAEPNPCGTLAASSVPGTITYADNLGPPSNQARVDFTPTRLLDQNSWYQITLKDNITSLDGFKLDGNKDGVEGGDYVFKFKTRNNTDLCEVGWVGVQPYERTAQEEGEMIAYQGDALAAGDACLMLNSSTYHWNWSVVDPASRLSTFATVDGGKTLDAEGHEIDATVGGATDLSRSVATVLLETVGTPETAHPPVRITGTIPAPISKSGYGNLTINFADPKVVEQWPDCQDACVDAAIGVRFNTGMTKTSVENTNNLKLFVWRCGNGVIDPGEDCDDGNATPGDGCSANCLNEGTPLCAGFDPAHPETPGTGQNCCGNGHRDPGEDCDGVPFPDRCKADTAAGVRNNCINLGTDLTSVPGGTCNNAVVDEGEDCDPPNVPSSPAPFGSLGCSMNCLNQGTSVLTPWRGGFDLHPTYTESEVSGRKRYELDFGFSPPPPSDLLSNTWYRAVISGEVESKSGVKIQPPDLNYGLNAAGTNDSYSWAFKTKSTDVTCAIDRVEVTPQTARLTYVGATKDFTSTPYGAPDQCSANGQRLRPLSYNWGWTSQYMTPPEVATLPSPLFDRYPKCGNGVREIGESCDDGGLCNDNVTHCTSDADCTVLNPAWTCTARSGDGCDGRCLHEGTSPPTCGNGHIDKGEDCDDGDAVSGDGCNSHCLDEGSVAGGSTCGNYAKEKGEGCDDGNTTSGDGCSNICRNEGAPITLPGLNPDGRVDPYQTATTIGLSAADVAADKTESTTEITASAGGKSGKALLTMACGYRLPGKPCPTRTPALGIGTDTCCYPKPRVVICDPSTTSGCSPEKENICRNALLSATFDQEMDLASISGDVILEGFYEPSETCPEGSARDSSGETCIGPGVGTVTISARTDTATHQTKVDISLNKLLDAGRRYRVIIKGDNPLTDSQVEGVKNKKGVALGGEGLIPFRDGGKDYQSWAWTFRAGSDICTLDSVEIDPAPYLFKALLQPGEEAPRFTAYPKDAAGDTISPIPGVYSWRWYWASSISDTAAENVASVTRDHLSDPVQGAQQLVTPANRNGEEIIQATAIISEDTVLHPSTAGLFQRTGTSDVTVFLCENPWPANEPASVTNPTGFFPFEDKIGSNDFSSPPPGTVYNFKTYYCRDRGEPEPAGNDDLPSFEPNPADVVRKDYTPSDPLKDELLREYLFTFPSASGTNPYYCSLSQTPCDPTDPTTCLAGAGECRPTPDAIGIRIYENADHLTPTEWYAAQGLAFGSPESITVDGYDAVKDGRTVYVAAANDSGTASTIYTNIYLISYNDGANPDTINIYGQLLDNLHFNVNLAAENLGTCLYQVCSNDPTTGCRENSECGSPPAVCNDIVSCSKDMDCTGPGNICQAPKDKLIRDVKRIIDLTKIKKSIDTYRSSKGYNPKLEAGTYIRALTASVWGSWAGVLGGELGGGLPTDPINKIINCPAKVCSKNPDKPCATDADCSETEGKCAAFDTTTCWNVDAGVYQCPAGSHIYQYQFYPSDGSYKLQSDFEYGRNITDWSKALPSDFETSNTCSGTNISNTGVCGDGVINTDSGETCEVGMNKYCSATGSDPSKVGLGCTADADCGSGTGLCVLKEDPCIIRTCEKSGRAKFCSANVGRGCTADADCAGAGTCVQEISVAGDCPSDAPNVTRKQYGRQSYECNPANCTWRAVGSCSALCGDGVVQHQPGYNEQCDQGPLGGRVPHGGTSYDNQYACTRADSSNPCQWTGGYCGDSHQDTPYGERCDDGPPVGSPSALGNGTYGIKPGTSPARSWCKLDCTGAGPYCGDEVVNGPEQCDKNTQNSPGVCVSFTDSASILPYSSLTPSSTANYNPCSTANDCSAGTCHGGANDGQLCHYPEECGVGSSCVGSEICVTCPTGSCAADSTRACRDNSDCAGLGGSTTCVTPGYPRTRTRNCKNPGDTDQCQWNNWGSCQAAGTCGNGVKEGAEECDDGNTNNNDSCTNACKNARCGDGFVHTGVEACDAGTANGRACTPSYGETCNYCSTTCSTLTVTGERCGDGIKNGLETCDGRQGTQLSFATFPAPPAAGGEKYFTIGGASTGVRVPTPPLECAAGTSGICTGQLASGDLVWSRPMCAADCQSTCPPSYTMQTLTFNVERRTSIELGSGELASVELPPCRLLGDIKADIDLSGVTPTQLNVVFVTDKSGSMGTSTGQPCGTRMECAKTALKNAISQLFDSYENVSIGLVSYNTYVTRDSGLMGPTGRATLTSLVDAYTPTGSTYTNKGFDEASALLSGATGKKIIILMSDGVASNSSLASAAADAVKAAGSEIYTILFYETSPNAIADMTSWSSDPHDVHFYQASSDLTAVYQTIINNITAATVTLRYSSDFSTPGVRSGTQIPLNFGSLLSCGSSPRSFNFKIEFSGEGKVQVSNLKAYTCSGPPYNPGITVH